MSECRDCEVQGGICYACIQDVKDDRAYESYRDGDDDA